jgi:hypothetical protein
VPASPSPSRFYRQHHTVEAPRVDLQVFQPAWRVKSRLDRLLCDDSVTLQEWRAALAYRASWECALGSAVRAIELDGTDRVAPSYRSARLERNEAQLDALRRLASVRQILGAVAVNLIEACVVADQSWSAIGRRLRIDHKTARTGTIAAIRALAGAWS